MDRKLDPKFAQIHMIDANEMRDRFDRAYAARGAAGHSLPEGRGVWVSLYDEESTDPASRVGAGVGIAHPPIVRVPLDEVDAPTISPPNAGETQPASASHADEEPLTIAEAKARLARTLGVDPASIRIYSVLYAGGDPPLLMTHFPLLRVPEGCVNLHAIFTTRRCRAAPVTLPARSLTQAVLHTDRTLPINTLSFMMYNWHEAFGKPEPEVVGYAYRRRS